MAVEEPVENSHWQNGKHAMVANVTTIYVVTLATIMKQHLISKFAKVASFHVAMQGKLNGTLVSNGLTLLIQMPNF